MHRVGAGLAACWVMRGSTYPKGTYVALFLATGWWVGRALWSEGRINVVDGALLFVTTYLMAISFWEGFTSLPDLPSNEPAAR